MIILNESIKDLKQLALEKKAEYQNGSPFPHMVIDNFFDEKMLDEVLAEFPDLSKRKNVNSYNGLDQIKLEAKGEINMGEASKKLVHFLNSQPFLEFLQELTGIKEVLLSDPYLEGGGYHEIKPGGMLKIHADFNQHETTYLDRRVNVLVYLNKDWEESYGGHFELWDKDMTKSYAKILPLFNRMALFSTTDFSYHGHPNPLTCPEDRSRKSIALYYYSNGRPKNEIIKKGYATHFVDRPGQNETYKAPTSAKTILKSFLPPILVDAVKGAKSLLKGK